MTWRVIFLAYVALGCLYVLWHGRLWWSETEAEIRRSARWPVRVPVRFALIGAGIVIGLLLDVLLWPTSELRRRGF